jgi:hypothetical protein
MKMNDVCFFPDLPQKIMKGGCQRRRINPPPLRRFENAYTVETFFIEAVRRVGYENLDVHSPILQPFPQKIEMAFNAPFNRRIVIFVNM